MKINRFTYISIVLFVLFNLISFSGFSQKKSRFQLEKEKKDQIRQIETTNKILSETEKEKNATLGQLNAIKQKIVEQQRLINAIDKEIKLIEEEMTETEAIISSLQNDLENLKLEYSKMIYESSKTSNKVNKLMFLFSASSFNNLAMRIKYLEQYTAARQMQAEQIEKVKSFLNVEVKNLTNKRIEKKILLDTQRIENENLIGLKKQQDVVVKSLTEKEKELKKELKEYEKSLRKLENLIEDLLKEEIEKSKKQANNKSKENKVVLTPETKMISDNFAANKGKLIWPLQQGFISGKFGKHPHAVLKNVQVENLGIDIQTNENENIRSVFDGKVTAVASVPGMNNIVMIQHGEYFTVYAKLKSVSVTTGQKITAKDIIGTVYTDKDKVSELQFQIWKNSEKLNPEHWLYKK
jgi:murein hydrolase activator